MAVISAVLNNRQHVVMRNWLKQHAGNMLWGNEKTGKVLQAERTETTGNML